MDDETPRRRSDDDPPWKVALKAGVLVVSLVGAGVTVGLLWAPMANTIDAAATASKERREMRDDIDRNAYEICVNRAYMNWISCRGVFDGAPNGCDQRHQEAQAACPRP